MAKVFSGLFGGGEKPKKVEPPKESEAEKAKAIERERLRNARGFRSTILGSMFQAGKAKLGQ